MTKSIAYGYVRVSGKGQIDGDGFDRQEQAIRQYAETNGIEVTRIFREEGVSGTVEKRPALARMMVDLEENGHGIKAVIIEKMDRLARDLMVQEAIIRDFQKSGFDLLSATEGSDLLGNDPTRKLVRQMMGAIAEYDKSMTVEKLRAARERIRARGKKCEGRKSINETEGGTDLVHRIKLMLRKRKDGSKPTLAEVATQLNQANVMTVTGKPFTVANVHKLSQPPRKSMR